MEFDPEVASRRIHRIASHFHPHPSDPVPASLTTTVCSAGNDLHHGSRKDSRLVYARQGSITQAFYMRQSQVVLLKEKDCSCQKEGLETEITTSSVSHSIPKLEDDPLFSKPMSNQGSPKDGEPLFARRASKDGRGQIIEGDRFKDPQICKTIGLEWVPRMDVVESRLAYVVIVELPGAHAEGIHVEVNGSRLVVMGTRTSERWLDNCKVEQDAMYHRRELLQGPYRVTWQIPGDCDIDSITAEFIDGFLRILVPKQ